MTDLVLKVLSYTLISVIAVIIGGFIAADVAIAVTKVGMTEGMIEATVANTAVEENDEEDSWVICLISDAASATETQSSPSSFLASVL